MLTRDTVWFTDSQNARLFALPLGPKGELPAPEDVVTVPLTGEWVQNAGLNANGITQTPDGRALLVVNSSTGELFRVDRESGEATEVDLGGSLLTNGDGLLLQGRTLYAVQNRLNKVAVVELDKAGTSGTKVREITSPDFDVPTTVAKLGQAALPAQRALHHAADADDRLLGDPGQRSLSPVSVRLPTCGSMSSGLAGRATDTVGEGRPHCSRPSRATGPIRS